MLALTDNATSVIRNLLDRPDLPDGTGMRIAQPPDGSDGLAVTPAVTVRHGDQVVESEGARVFLDRATADMLDDKVLDANVDNTGVVRFLIGDQPD